MKESKRNVGRGREKVRKKIRDGGKKWEDRGQERG